MSAVSGAVAVSSTSDTGKHDSVAELRAKIATMKQKLESVKKDPKTDCKTKDWQMQSLQRSIAQTQVQVSAQETRATKAAESPPAKESDDTKRAKKPEGSVGSLVDVYA